MKVILIKDIPEVGQKNDIKEVKDGFALNMLIPRGLAKQATSGAVSQLEKARIQEEKVAASSAAALEAKVANLSQIEIKAKANEKGHLFAGVGKDEIAKKIGIPGENITLEHPIKELGEYEIEIKTKDKTTKKVKLVLSQE